MKKKIYLQIPVIVATIFIFVITSLVSASYTGPGTRTIATSTTWKRWYCTLDYNLYDDVNPRGQMPRYLSPSTGCPSGYYQFDYGYNPGSLTKMYYRISISWSDYVGNGGTYTGFMKYAGEHLMLVNWYQVNAELQDCTEGQEACGQVSVYTTYDPATVSGTNSCTLAGSNGWCKGVGTLSLSSTEPMPGQSITSIDNASGTLCTGGSCVLTYPEGTTSYTYWAVSSFGDTSVQATSSMSVDSVPPTADLSISGDVENGWYNGKSPIVFTTTGTDTTSGVASEQVIFSGGSSENSPYTYSGSDSSSLSVYGSVTDTAGNSTDTPSQTIKIDTTNPIISPYISSGTLGNNNYYITNVTLGASVSDNLSGVNTYSPSSVTFTTDGTHTQNFSISDNAGNSGSGSITIKIDKTKPDATLSVTSGLPGLSGWYKSNVTVSADATDLTSGIASVSPSTSIILDDEGANTATFVIEDLAGNTGTYSTSPIMIDTVKPSLAPTIEGTLGKNGWYISDVTVRGNATDATSGILIDPVLNFSDGIHTSALLTAEDNAGNFITETLSDPIKVDTEAPTITFDEIPQKIVSSVNLSGTVQDDTSGMDQFQVSTNGGLSWTTVSINSDGTWEMPDTTLVFSAAKALIIGKASDLAGNTSTINLEASEYQNPVVATNTPTITPTRTPTNTPTVTATPIPTKTEGSINQIFIPNTSDVLTETPAPTEVLPVVFADTETAIHSKRGSNNKAISYIILLSFITVLGLTTINDPRLLEVKRLAQAINDQNTDIMKEKKN